MDTDNKENVPVSTSQKDVANATWPAFRHPIAAMERAFDRFFGRGAPSIWHWDSLPTVDSLFEIEGLRIPSLDLIDLESEIIVRAEITGIDKKDLNVSLADNVLSIKGQSRHKEKDEKGDYYRHEISSASFARSVSVPVGVDASKIVANLKNGILEIKLPKMELSKKHNIAII
jgi:HSP20 family protein